MALAIKDFDSVWCRGDAARLKKLSWLSMPVALDNARLARLVTAPGGVEAFGVFILLVQVAAQSSSRGVIVLDDEETLAAVIRVPVETLRRAIEVLTSTRIGWLVRVDWENRISESETRFCDESRRISENLGESRRISVIDQTNRQERTEDNRTRQTDACVREGAECVNGSGSHLAGSDSSAQVPGWLTDPDDALKELGIGEPIRSQLVDAGIDIDTIKRVATDVSSQPESVFWSRNPDGTANRKPILVRNLANECGVKLRQSDIRKHAANVAAAAAEQRVAAAARQLGINPRDPPPTPEERKAIQVKIRDQIEQLKQSGPTAHNPAVVHAAQKA